jgi:hypothetical protein
MWMGYEKEELKFNDIDSTQRTPIQSIRHTQMVKHSPPAAQTVQKENHLAANLTELSLRKHDESWSEATLIILNCKIMLHVDSLIFGKVTVANHEVWKR